MKQNPTITYIKNGVEKTVTINIFNHNKVLKEIYRVSHEDLTTTYTINSDIEFIHFKNFSFNKVETIKCSKETICIIEKCTFELDERLGYNLYFSGGFFQLIDLVPTSKNKGIYLFEAQDFDITYTKELTKNQNKITIESQNRKKINSISVKDNKNIEGFDTYFGKMSLDGNFELSTCDLEGEQIQIGNEQELTSIIVGAYSTYIEASQEIQLTNCLLDKSIKKFGQRNLDIKAPKIQVSNTILKAGFSIRINSDIYKKKPKETEVVVTDKDLVRTNLISILKGYKNQLEHQIEAQSQEYIKDSFLETREQLKEHQEKVSELERKVKTEQLELINLKEELATKQEAKAKAITRSLSRKPIKSLK